MPVASVLSWLWMAELVTSNAGNDYYFFVEAAERWQQTGTPYRVEQLTGPYIASNGISMLYPPIALYLFVPFTVLPAVLWWVIPIGIVTWHVVSARPAWWAWPLIAFALFLPRAQHILILGNTAMWVTALVALGLRYAWVSPFVLLKPTFLPFALIGIRRRAWWAGFALLCLVSLAMLPLWLDYYDAMRFNVGPFPGSLLYSLADYPMVMIPVVAWWAREPR